MGHDHTNAAVPFRGRILAALLLALPASRLGATGCVGDSSGELVKTSFDSYFSVAVGGGDCTAGPYSYYDFAMSLTGFAVGRSAVPWPGADTGVHTGNPVTVNPTLADMDGNGTLDARYHFQTGSLKDIGTYTYQITGDYTDGYSIYPVSPESINFPVYNDPPTASISLSGDVHVGHTVTLNAAASDPDGGAIPHFEWSVDSKPAGSPDNVSDATSATGHLALNDKHSIGNWTLRLKVGDNEGEKVETTHPFNVPNQPPTVTVSGSTSINALEHIHLQADPTHDADGETITWVWDILTAPPAAANHPQSGFSTSQTVDFVTGPHDIGTWSFRCTATDEHMASVHQDVTVVVHAVPPHITIDNPVRTIRLGDSTAFVDTTLNDAYGAPLNFDWELTQVPAEPGVPLGHYGSGSSITVPDVSAPGNELAGTWKLTLIVTDQVNETSSATVKVLIDADPIPVITGPDQSGNLTLPLDLDGSGSKDPDTDNPHIGGNDLSPGIVSWQWSILDVPPDVYADGSAYPGPVDDVLGVTGTDPTLHIPAGKLHPGHWVFRLEVRDGEDNTKETTHGVDIIDEGLPPQVILGPARFYTVNLAGVTPVDIQASGAASFDWDNLLTSPYSPGLGITHYTWSYTVPPAGCGVLPPLPDSDTGATATLYAAGDAVPGLCQGVQQLRLTITDDDTPTHKQSSGDTQVFIGNCPGDLCIDYPTEDDHASFKFSDQTDVVVYYHMNSLYYDFAAYAAGLRLHMKIYHESNLFTPVYDDVWDADLLPSDKGGYLAVHWSGYDNAGARPLPGKYTVTVQLEDGSGAPAGGIASQPESVWIQTLDVEASSGTSRYVDHDALVAGSTTVHIDYDVTGQNPGETGFDELRTRIYSWPANGLLYEASSFGPFTGSLDWNGDLGGGTFLSTGTYRLQLEIDDLGAVLGVSPSTTTFTVYHMSIAPSTGTVSTHFPGLRLAVNDDDDNLDGVSDLIEAGLPEENDLIRFTFSIDPAVPGNLVVDSTAPGVVQAWTTAAKGALKVFPAAFPLPATPLPAELFLEGVTAGKTMISLSLQTAGGDRLGPKSFAVTTYDVAVLNDTNGDFAPDTQTFFVRPGLWDGAFRLTPDVFGSSGTLFNQEDATRLGISGNPENFVGRDSRRFYFQVKDPAANADPGTVEEIPLDRFEWSTLAATSPAVNDDFPPTHRGLTLRETGPDTGVFVSQAVMLVTDPVDVSTPTNSGLPSHPGKPAYDQDNHRTRRVSGVDSFLDLRYRPSGAAGPVAERRLPVFQRVPEERRVLTLHIFNFADPLNLMVPAVPQAFIDLTTQTLKERYAACGVKARFLFTPATDVLNLPLGSPVNLASVADFTGSYQTLAPSADQTALINLTRPLEAGADVVRLMYINGFAAGMRGESFPDGWLPVGSTVPVNFVFISGGVGVRYTAAHETGHMVTNATLTAAEAGGMAPGWGGGGHYNGPQNRFNVMRPSTFAAGATDDSKRFWDDLAVHLVQQITRMRGTRYMKMP